MNRRLLALATVVLLAACAPRVRGRPMPQAASLTTVADLRRSIQDPGRVWLIVGLSASHSALYLDSLPADEVIAVVGRDSVTPIWGPKHLALVIERCGWADTVLTQRGRREIHRSAPCPWNRHATGARAR